MAIIEQFRIKPDGFKEIKKAILIKTIPISLLAAIGGLAISYFNPTVQQSEVNVFPFVIPMMLGVMAFSLFRSIKRQEKLFNSYRLTLDKDFIVREQLNTPTISISLNDISEIIKNSNGSITIKGNSPVNIIVVPSQIDDYDKLENLLSVIKPVSIHTSEPFLQKYRGLLSVLTIGLMAAVYLSKNKVIVGISGVILLITIGYSFFEVQRSKNVDNKTKKGMWWIILVSASIIGIMYFKLTSQQ